jgi:hypothetical protein
MNVSFSLSKAVIYSVKVKPSKSYRRGRLSLVDLFLLTTLDQLVFKLQISFIFFT